jgi:hypothetical protein
MCNDKKNVKDSYHQDPKTLCKTCSINNVPNSTHFKGISDILPQTQKAQTNKSGKLILSNPNPSNAKHSNFNLNSNFNYITPTKFSFKNKLQYPNRYPRLFPTFNSKYLRHTRHNTKTTSLIFELSHEAAQNSMTVLQCFHKSIKKCIQFNKHSFISHGSEFRCKQYRHLYSCTDTTGPN